MTIRVVSVNLFSWVFWRVSDMLSSHPGHSTGWRLVPEEFKNPGAGREVGEACRTGQQVLPQLSA